MKIYPQRTRKRRPVLSRLKKRKGFLKLKTKTCPLKIKSKKQP
jgi:hypothetical protein